MSFILPGKSWKTVLDQGLCPEEHLTEQDIWEGTHFQGQRIVFYNSRKWRSSFQLLLEYYTVLVCIIVVELCGTVSKFVKIISVCIPL